MSSNPYGLNANIKNVKSKQPSYILPWKNGKWGPEGWYRYKVRFGDNWWSVANKDGWSDPMDLIEYNFKTRKPQEINWYLRNFVGCKYATPDGLNHIFSDNLAPGYIYTVHKLQEEPAPVPVKPPMPDIDLQEGDGIVRPGVWFGFGLKGGAFAGVGYDRTEALMFSSDYTDVFSMSIDTLKFGGGAGIGGAAVAVIASGLPRLSELRHCVINGMDWNLSVGLRMKGFATAASSMSGVRYLINAMRTKPNPGLKALSEGAAGLKAIVGTTGAIDYGTKPAVTVIEIPFMGLGLDISLYSGRSTFDVRTIRDSDVTLWDALKDAALGQAG